MTEATLAILVQVYIQSAIIHTQIYKIYLYICSPLLLKVCELIGTSVVYKSLKRYLHVIWWEIESNTALNPFTILQITEEAK